MYRIVVAVICAIGLVLVPEAKPAMALSNASFDAQLRPLTNTERTKKSLKKLKFGTCLDRYAQQQANRMASEKRMFHQDLRIVLRKCKAKTVGENVAYGFDSPKANVRAWMNSPGHRKNILNRKYTRLGIGVAKDGDGRSYTVQVFGRPR